jgi:broad specificity phosphatase PhoE
MISFVRHGETALNRDGRLQGRVDSELSDKGLEQAARLASRFKATAVTRLIASPLLRARQTAAAIAEVCGVAVEIDERLVELDYGEWDGRALAEMRPTRDATSFADPSFSPPGGESLLDVSARVASFCADRLVADQRVLAVSHVSPIKAAVAWALGVDERATLRMQLVLASITNIGARPDGTGYLVSFNETAHLKG